jgi:glycosyltransferase involved in cell wall biosynthesis
LKVADFNPKVSVVVPVFNGEKYLKVALHSLVTQTYLNIEIIVVDDGSEEKEKIRTIVNSFNDSRIKFYTKDNGGVSSALNLAVEKAEGDYFTWLSHDDAFLPSKIAEQVVVLEQKLNPKFVSFTSYQTINGDGKLISKLELSPELSKAVTPLGPIERGVLYGCTAMFNLDFIRQVGIFDPGLRFVQDYDYWLKLFDQGAIFELLDKPLVQIRLHEEQTGKTSDTYDENYQLWQDIAHRWVAYCSENYSDIENLSHLKQFKRFVIENKVEGAVRVLEVFQKSILEKYLVTVIVPTRGRLHLLPRCLKSILTQELVNLQILVVDDNTDSNLSAATQLLINSLGDERIKVLKNNKTHGPAGSRNIALDEARGNFVAFLDSDDFFLPDKLSNQLAEMLISSTDFSHTNYLRSYELQNRSLIVDTSHHSGNNQLKFILERGCGISTSTTMIRFSEPMSKIRFDENKRYGEDIFYFLDFAFCSSNPFLHLDFVGTCMRSHIESAATDKKAQSTHAKDISNLLLGLDENRPAYSVGVKRKSRLRNFVSNKFGNKLLSLTRKQRTFLFQIVYKVTPKGKIFKYLSKSKVGTLIKELMLS